LGFKGGKKRKGLETEVFLLLFEKREKVTAGIVEENTFSGFAGIGSDYRRKGSKEGKA